MLRAPKVIGRPGQHTFVRLLTKKGVKPKPFDNPILEVSEVFRLDVISLFMEGNDLTTRVTFHITQPQDQGMDSSYPLELEETTAIDPDEQAVEFSLSCFKFFFEQPDPEAFRSIKPPKENLQHYGFRGTDFWLSPPCMAEMHRQLHDLDEAEVDAIKSTVKYIIRKRHDWCLIWITLVTDLPQLMKIMAELLPVPENQFF